MGETLGLICYLITKAVPSTYF